MKIKKLLIGLLVSGLAFSFTGCGDKEINDNGEKVQSFGQFIEIKEIQIVNQKSQSMEKIIMDKEKEKLSKEIVSS